MNVTYYNSVCCIPMAFQWCGNVSSCTYCLQNSKLFCKIFSLTFLASEEFLQSLSHLNASNFCIFQCFLFSCHFCFLLVPPLCRLSFFLFTSSIFFAILPLNCVVPLMVDRACSHLGVGFNIDCASMTLSDLTFMTFRNSMTLSDLTLNLSFLKYKPRL